MTIGKWERMPLIVNDDSKNNILITPITPSEPLKPTTIDEPLKADSIDLPLIAVLDFQIENIPKNEGVIIVDLLGSALFETKKFRIIERTQREKILGEIAFSFEDCVDEACQIEAGRLMAAKKIVVGSIARISSRYIFTTKLIDVSTGETIATAAEVYKTMEELIDSTTGIAIKLSNY